MSRVNKLVIGVVLLPVLVGMLVALNGCGVSQEDYDQVVTERDEYKAALEEAQAALGEAQGTLLELQSRLEGIELLISDVTNHNLPWENRLAVAEDVESSLLDLESELSSLEDNLSDAQNTVDSCL